ncbi:MAG: hypothetical protein JWN34_201 [Bryobacterales bacterium]|nr:hypothetical protein [Bryobacterales bacterium]
MRVRRSAQIVMDPSGDASSTPVLLTVPKKLSRKRVGRRSFAVTGCSAGLYQNGVFVDEARVNALTLTVRCFRGIPACRLRAGASAPRKFGKVTDLLVRDFECTLPDGTILTRELF